MKRFISDAATPVSLKINVIRTDGEGECERTFQGFLGELTVASHTSSIRPETSSIMARWREGREY